MKKIKIIALFFCILLFALTFILAIEPPNNQTNTKTCIETDGGKNYYTKGNITEVWSNGGKVGYNDICTDTNNEETAMPVSQGPYLIERYCSGNETSAEFYQCPNGCLNGACVNESKSSQLQDQPGSDNYLNKPVDKTKRANYGACISEHTKIKNLCYREERIAYKDCEMQVRKQFREERSVENVNISQILNQMRERSKTCKREYNKGLNECRLAFNASKKSCEVWRIPTTRKLTQETCTLGGGRWNECGSKCTINSQGRENIVCPTVCEALCECGTIAGLTCPKGYNCIMPKGVADAMGYCR